MKTLLGAGLVTILLSGSTAFASETIRYYNRDSQSYTWTVVASGTKRTVQFDKSCTASVTLQGSGPYKIETPSGSVTLKGGEKIEIKDAKIIIVK